MKVSWKDIFTTPAVIMATLTLVLALAIAACVPPGGLVGGDEPAPEPTAEVINRNIEIEFYDGGWSRLVDEEQGMVCYSRNNGIDCVELLTP